MQCRAINCSREAITKGCCDKHYRRLLKRGSIDDRGSRHVVEGNEAERFHGKYEKSGDCWIWVAGTRPNAKGTLYGRHYMDNGKSIGAHRFSYMLHHGDIPTGGYICHKCDTPLCVNPDHLFLSDHKGNMEDMVKKGRSYKGSGEKANSSKLTNEQATEIRRSTLSQSKLSKIYNVSQSTISRIKNMETYVHT